MTGQTAELAAIVDRVEKQNRWLKSMGFLAFLLAAAILTIGQARPRRTVVARKFVLEDASGRVRGTLLTGQEGPELALADEHGTVRASLNGEKFWASLALRDSKGLVRARLFASDNGQGAALLGASGKTGVLLGMGADGPILRLSDSHGSSTSIGSANWPLLEGNIGLIRDCIPFEKGVGVPRLSFDRKAHKVKAFSN